MWLISDNTVYKLLPYKVTYYVHSVSADPDLVANDGIYSRYLTDYPRPGRCGLLCNQHSP